MTGKDKMNSVVRQGRHMIGDDLVMDVVDCVLELSHTARKHVLRHVLNIALDSCSTCLVWTFKPPNMFGDAAVWTFRGRK